jgi:diguanylate cyclase (GGDEF)-like protein
MGFGAETKHQGKAGFFPTLPPPSPLVLPGPLHVVSRLIPPLSLGLLIALIIGAVVFYEHARQADERIEFEQRMALNSGIEKLALLHDGNSDIAPSSLRLLETLSGAKSLRWETNPEPRPGGRHVQPLWDGQGRILGWLSWNAEHPMKQAVARFLPLWTAIAVGLLVLGALSAWYIRQLSGELADSEARARKVSREDPLTGLPNGSSIFETLEQALATREPHEVVTSSYLDLAGFRALTDTFGQPFCNEVVRQIAARLVEPSSPLSPRSTVGRIGRHRFIIVTQAESVEVGLRVAHEAADRIAKPLWVQGQSVQLAAFIGLAHAPRDGLGCDELFRHATLAMRAAKRKGGGTIMSFAPSMEADMQEQRFIERELKRALNQDALELYYQPIVAGEGDRIVGVEALLRWNHPTRGYIPPLTFIPVAEQSGMMAQLGEFVLYRALNDAKRWPDLFVAVNLSPIQVKDRALLELVSSMLAETGIDPSRVVLEITESVMIEDPEDTRQRLEELRDLGVRIALDDFGSGYSSLSYLQHFPFDKLKIDGDFVAPLGISPNSAVIIQAIVALGRALNLSVLVEGVETEEQCLLLRLAGCDEMQGYLFAKPGPREAIDRLLLDAKLQAARDATAKLRA